jgi:DNA repair protein RecO (recombination protein O)
MIVQSKAVLISSLKYGDKDLILKLYTLEDGIKSFMLKNAFSPRKKNTFKFLPLSSVNIVYDSKQNKNFLFFREISSAHFYQAIYSNPYKQAVILFLSEILNSVLTAEEKDENLFDFIENSLIEFDSKSNYYADFHLWFLINLTRNLGFYPNRINENSTYFDLENGVFTNETEATSFIGQNDLKLFIRLLNLDFSRQTENLFSREQRNQLLLNLIRYYELHVHGFRKPNSLEVLNQIFK